MKILDLVLILILYQMIKRMKKAKMMKNKNNRIWMVLLNPPKNRIITKNNHFKIVKIKNKICKTKIFNFHSKMNSQIQTYKVKLWIKSLLNHKDSLRNQLIKYFLRHRMKMKFRNRKANKKLKIEYSNTRNRKQETNILCKTIYN